MGFQNLKVVERTVEVPDGGSFSVRGLALEDITHLVSEHGDTFRQLYDSVISPDADPDNVQVDDLDLNDFSALSGTLLKQAPKLAAAIIACAGDDPGAVDVVRKLALPSQLEALEAVAELTFVGEDGGKKLFQTVIQMAAKLTRFTTGLRTSTPG